ncbi:MAG: hypothetical protein JNL41_16730 [Phenylobacterium sp.]|uniref:hypothetical protein n=1 Tax=Phenylobacterium sp. TaxID=1871053 RepID=UPI001A4CF947|nr:hypothetical protein [Phenylobacterium sp.]MBL8555924.1 hypothetical protein [Phenylobacterium sp.]
MKAAVVLAIALLLAGCEHMYGAVDAASINAQLIEQARRATAGEHISVDGMTPTVLDRGRVWVIHFERPDPNVLDGGVAVLINKKTRRVEGIANDA